MHIPVLLNQVIEFIDVENGAVFIDATAGGGGHIKAILEKLKEDGVLIGIDQDKKMISELEKKFANEKRLSLINGNFRNIEDLAEKYKGRVDGILYDLGFNSMQLEESRRGFSFLKNEPLLMTYEANPDPQDLTAERIVNTWREGDIRKIFIEYGEERFAASIARNIVKNRKKSKIKTTADLVNIIQYSIPAKRRRGKIHPATRIFQALRIAVNDELNALEDGLNGGWELLGNNGRMVVISFHSLEDRIVKNFFKSKKREEDSEILTKKPIIPEDLEIAKNPRSRSAKLRAIKK